MSKANEGTRKLPAWTELAAAVRFKTRCFIEGRYTDSESSTSYDTVNPATEGRLASFPVGAVSDVDRAVRSARAAFTSWRKLAPTQRKRVLLAVAAAVERRAHEFALFDSLEMGKPISLATGDALFTANLLRFYAESADKVYGELAPTDPATGLVLSMREPFGVVGAITPWNFPLLAACLAVAPALAAGNVVVLKPSEVSPSSALLLGEVAVEAGLPAGVLNIVPGLGPSVGAALASHMDVDKLHFTGSTANGRRMLEYAGRSNGKSVMLEVGGKSPQIVFKDAVDIENLVTTIAAAAFFNTGQVCVARTRLLVDESIREQVVAQLQDECARYEIGDPLADSSRYGPLASAQQHQRVRGFVDEAIRGGAEVVAGGEACAPGLFWRPTVLTRVASRSRIAQEEVFGPVLTVHSFRDEAEATALAHDTAFGLAATVWTRDLARAMRFAHTIDAGRIEIRSCALPASTLELFAAEPLRGSGHGALGGLRGLDPYVRHKGVEIIAA